MVLAEVTPSLSRLLDEERLLLIVDRDSHKTNSTASLTLPTTTNVLNTPAPNAASVSSSFPALPAALSAILNSTASQSQGMPASRVVGSMNQSTSASVNQSTSNSMNQAPASSQTFTSPVTGVVGLTGPSPALLSSTGHIHRQADADVILGIVRSSGFQPSNNASGRHASQRARQTFHCRCRSCLGASN